jgi:polygalacturonase
MNRREVLGYAAASAAAFTTTAKHALGGPNQAKTGPVGDSAKAAAGAYNVKDFGAAGNSSTLDTQAINKTIEACSAAGGGTVLFPAGVYLSGTVHLKSDLTLYLDAGATILGSKNLKDYEDVVRKAGHSADWHAALLEGHDLHNVAITGRGVVDGNKVFNPDGEEHMRGPMAIFFHKCDGISVQDIYVKDAANYAHLMDDCSNGNVRGVTVTGGWDAIHLLNCKDFIITDCRFMTGDDCVAGGGWERVVVANTSLNTSCNGFRIGGFRGEMIDPSVPNSGNVKNVAFTNLILWGPGVNEHRTSNRHDMLAAFNIGGGVVDNLVISNVSVSNLRSPLWMGVRNAPAAMRNVSVNNLTATAVGGGPLWNGPTPAWVRPQQYSASRIQGGQDNPVESISLSNITIVSDGGGAKELVGQPFPATTGGDANVSLPCYGLYCRYIKDLDLHNVRFSYSEKDARPALICESIERLELDGVRGQPGTESETSIVLRDIKTLRSSDAEVLPK